MTLKEKIKGIISNPSIGNQKTYINGQEYYLAMEHNRLAIYKEKEKIDFEDLTEEEQEKLYDRCRYDGWTNPLKEEELLEAKKETEEKEKGPEKEVREKEELKKEEKKEKELDAKEEKQNIGLGLLGAGIVVGTAELAEQNKDNGPEQEEAKTTGGQTTTDVSKTVTVEERSEIKEAINYEGDTVKFEEKTEQYHTAVAANPHTANAISDAKDCALLLADRGENATFNIGDLTFSEKGISSGGKSIGATAAITIASGMKDFVSLVAEKTDGLLVGENELELFQR